MRMSHWDAIGWRSLFRALCSESAKSGHHNLLLHERTEQRRRPWRMRSTAARNDGLHEVKGVATDASTGRSRG